MNDGKRGRLFLPIVEKEMTEQLSTAVCNAFAFPAATSSIEVSQKQLLTTDSLYIHKPIALNV